MEQAQQPAFKLNLKRTFLIGFAFFGILLLWQVYDSWCPPLLTELFKKQGIMGSAALQPKVRESKTEISENMIRTSSKDMIFKGVKDPNIYIPKCLMVMSLYPYFAEYEKILTEIYNYSLNAEDDTELTKEKSLNISTIINSKSVEIMQPSRTISNLENHLKQESPILIPIDKIIENLLIELPVPPRGIFNVQYTLINEERKLKQNLINLYV